MATCPECHVKYEDTVDSCPHHGSALIPDALVLPDEPPLEEGMMVGEYRVEHKLGAGTFGDVYAGEQPLIGKRVAIKVLNRRFASDPVMVSRFVAEARAVNKIRQRNIIDIFSFGVLPGTGRHYFVMELLEGMTLGQLLDRTGRLPVAHVLAIVRGIADALDAVHESGITHRDLKPDNVFLARERDGSYFPKLLDFGIAKLLGEDVAHKTGSGMVLGTPRYMSPEQARGKKADHRSDIYALGVMIHEMLTGGPLFEGDSAVDMLLKQAVEDPRPLTEVCPDLPRELEAPVLDMLRKRPDDRPPTAGKAVAALAECARRIGLDRPETTLAELASDGTPTREAVPKFTGTTLTVDRPRRTPSGDRAAAPSTPRDGGAAISPRGASGNRAADPMSKTERAPASEPEAIAAAEDAQKRRAEASGAGATLLSPAVSKAATPVASESLHERGPTTESVSTLETASAIRRFNRTRRILVGTGVAAAAGLGIALVMLGQQGPKASQGLGPSTTATVVDAPKAPVQALTAAHETTKADGEPTVRPAEESPRTVPHPEGTALASGADAGAPLKSPATPVKSTTKSTSGGRNLDRLLGDR